MLIELSETEIKTVRHALHTVLSLSGNGSIWRAKSNAAAKVYAVNKSIGEQLAKKRVDMNTPWHYDAEEADLG